MKMRISQLSRTAHKAIAQDTASASCFACENTRQNTDFLTSSCDKSGSGDTKQKTALQATVRITYCMLNLLMHGSKLTGPLYLKTSTVYSPG